MSTTRKRKATVFKIRPLSEAELRRAREAAERLRENREAIRREFGTFDVAQIIREVRDDSESAYSQGDR